MCPEAMAALREEGRTVWATDLAQGAVVLAPGAAWLGDTPASLPEKLALVIGTESTGVSQFILDNADRRVYLPQNGFADSLNASVAAALCLHTVLGLYGDRARGDLVATGPAEAVTALRREWCAHLSRDGEQLERMQRMLEAAEAEGGARTFDDLRRADEFRVHNGKPTKYTRRRDYKQALAKSAAGPTGAEAGAEAGAQAEGKD